MALALIFLALGLGGILKGATGAGAPVIAVPVLAAVFDVPTAIVVMVVPNLISNIFQGLSYRHEMLPPRFSWRFSIGGAVGAALGTVVLAQLSSEALMMLVAVMVWLYLAFRFARPDWSLGYGAAERLSAPAGVFAGVLQGAGGLSAPVSITFLNAMNLERGQFVGTISLFFALMSLAQIPVLAWYGFMTGEKLVWSLLALAPLFGGMALGGWIGRRVSKAVFDRAVMALLALVSCKLAWEALV